MRLTAKRFTATVKANPSDETVAKWFTETVKAHPPAELAAWNHTRLNRGLSTPGKQEYFFKLRDSVDLLPHRPPSWTERLHEEGMDRLDRNARHVRHHPVRAAAIWLGC
jgi:hypothetical protein